jgi:hypothetical protein
MNGPRGTLPERQFRTFSAFTATLRKNTRKGVSLTMSKKQYKVEMPWFKVYSEKWLHGSIRVELEPSERSVWADLLALASKGHPRGTVSLSENLPYPHDYLARILNIPLELLDSTLSKCIAEGRIIEDGAGLHITNWDFYQSEAVSYSKEKKAKADSHQEKLPGLKRLSGQKPKKTRDTTKYFGGKYGHMVKK